VSRRAPPWLAGLVCALAMLLLAGRPAAAHTRSESHSVWEVNGVNVDLVMTIPEVEARRLSPTGPPSDDLIKAYLTARVYPTAAGKHCALLPPVETLSATPGFRKYDFTFRCATAGQISITSAAFFDLVPSHTNFAQIQNAATGEFTEQLITRDRQTVEVTGGESGRLLRLHRHGDHAHLHRGRPHVVPAGSGADLAQA